MKLRQVDPKEPVERLAVSMKKSTHELLECFRTAYKAKYGNEIELSALVEAILKDYISSDKDFMKKFEAGQFAPMQRAQGFQAQTNQG
jgi:hypothetical protein